MLRSIAGTAGVLSLTLLLAGACAGDDSDAATGAPASPNGSSITGSTGPLPAPGASGPGGPAAEAPLGSDGSPLPPPSRPANIPSIDPAALRSGWLTATVTKGGAGPCYGLKGADGEAWAIYSKKSVPLSKGDQVRARIEPGKTPVDCGAGKQATLVRVMIGSD